MNTDVIIPKINIQGSTSNEPLITFIQNYRWNNNNYCLATSNGYTYLNGVILNGNDNYNNIYINNNNLIFGINSENDNNNFIFSFNSNEKIRIKQNGYLGINNNNPQYHLDVNGSINYSSNIFKNNINLDNIYLNIKNNYWIADTNCNIFIDINSNINNVGIGTSQPLTTLHIGSTNTTKDISLMLSKYNDINSFNLNFKLGYDNSSNFIIGNSNIINREWYKQLSINLNAPTNSLIIDNNGNIGINTNNTNNNKLFVNGALNANTLSGIGSNITRLDYNNITINRPELSNLNNWIYNSATNTIYNNYINTNNFGIGIGTTNIKYTSTIISEGQTFIRDNYYSLNVNGIINTTELRINNNNLNNIYVTNQNAANTYLSNSLYPWITTNITDIQTLNAPNKLISLNNNYRINVGTTGEDNVNTLMTIYGKLYVNNIECLDGSNIRNIDYFNINRVPDFTTRSYADNTYLSQTNFTFYSNSIIQTYATNNQLAEEITRVNNNINLILGGSVSPALINTIATSLSTSEVAIPYNKITQNPIDYYSNATFKTFGFRLHNTKTSKSISTGIADIIDSNNIITVEGNVLASRFIASGNIKENNIFLSNIYKSISSFNNDIINYDKIVDRKNAFCTDVNYYPPINYQYKDDYFNIINNSSYGNGIYQIITSTSISYRNAEFDIPNYSEAQVNKSYRLFNTSNNPNNIEWQTGIDNNAINPTTGYYTNGIYAILENIANITRYNTSEVINGFWIQYYYSESLILNNIEIISSDSNSAPGKISLIAGNIYNQYAINSVIHSSPDTWDTLLENYTINYSSGYNTYNNYYIANISLPLNVNNYKYYRIIVTELVNKSNNYRHLKINQIKFKGKEIKKNLNHSGNNIYTYSNLSINTFDNIHYKLNVNGNIYSSSNIYANSNIGIGTTMPLANLHIGSINTNSDGSIIISKSNAINNNINFKIGYVNNDFIIGNYNVNNYFWNSQFIINSNATPNSFIINSNGNIGINTNNIDNNYKLNLNGSMIINNGIINQLNNSLSLNNINTFYNDIYASNNIFVSNIITSNLTVNSNSRFLNNLTCLSNIGIGIDIDINNDFKGKLHIDTYNTNNSIGIWNCSSQLNNGSRISQFIGKDDNNRNGFYMNYYHQDDNNNLNYLTFSTKNLYPIFYLNANCNIGIGITNPSGLFQIGNGGKFRIDKNDNSTAIFGLNDIDNSANTKIYLKNNSIEYYASINDGIHKFYTNNDEKLRIDFNGNVGIGIGTNITNNFKLNVNGNTYITSNLYLNSNLGIGTSNPIANIHLNNGSFLLNNFKFGNINNNTSNLIIGHCNITNNTWISQFIINSNASSNSLIISNSNYIGINNSNPIANLHIGDINKDNSSFIISQNNRNFKIGYDNNSNFILGDYGNTNNNSLNNWVSQLMINYNAPANSLIINNNGNIGINTNNIDNNYKLNLNGNIIQLGNLNNVFYGNVGIGTINNENCNLNVNGSLNVSSKINTSNINSYNIVNTNNFIQQGKVRIGTSINENSFPDSNIYISVNNTRIDGNINFNNGDNFIINLNNTTLNSTITTINNNLIIGSNGRLKLSTGFNDYSIIGTKDEENLYESLSNTRILLNGFNYNTNSLKGSIQYYSTNGGNHIFYSLDATGQTIQTQILERMRITSSGNIGIGTANPNNFKLNVNGDLNVSGNIVENSSFLSNTYVKKTELSNLTVGNLNIKKKYGYLATMGNSITINSIQYYSYNLNLSNLTKNYKINNNSSTFNRLFNIKCFITDDNFPNFNAGLPNILQYDIYMGSNTNNVNICAIGTPENYLLSNILPTNISLIKSSDPFNYLSIVSPIADVPICYIIEDYLS